VCAICGTGDSIRCAEHSDFITHKINNGYMCRKCKINVRHDVTQINLLNCACFSKNKEFIKEKKGIMLGKEYTKYIFTVVDADGHKHELKIKQSNIKNWSINGETVSFNAIGKFDKSGVFEVINYNLTLLRIHECYFTIDDINCRRTNNQCVYDIRKVNDIDEYRDDITTMETIDIANVKTDTEYYITTPRFFIPITPVLINVGSSGVFMRAHVEWRGGSIITNLIFVDKTVETTFHVPEVDYHESMSEPFVIKF
jgi:hypothetical protein